MFWDFGSLRQKHRESAGHLVVYFVTGLMVGERRFPGATILVVESIYLLSQPSLFQSRRQIQYIVMDSLSGLFWDFGSLYQRRCGVVSDALSRQRHSLSLRTLRRPQC